MADLETLWRHPDYLSLKHRILNVLDGCPDALRVPSMDFNGALHARVVIAVCETCDLSRGEWECLRDAEQIEWMRRTLQKLSEAAGTNGQPDAPGQHLFDDPAPPQTPVKWLTSWREITDALDLGHDQRDKVKSLNDRLSGPITKPQKGGQPIVDRDKLFDWWNKLATRQQDLANQRDGKLLSGAESYAWGKSGEAAPAVSGGVKKRRSDRQR